MIAVRAQQVGAIEEQSRIGVIRHSDEFSVDGIIGDQIGKVLGGVREIRIQVERVLRRHCRRDYVDGKDVWSIGGIVEEPAQQSELIDRCFRSREVLDDDAEFPGELFFFVRARGKNCLSSDPGWSSSLYWWGCGRGCVTRHDSEKQRNDKAAGKSRAKKCLDAPTKSECSETQRKRRRFMFSPGAGRSMAILHRPWRATAKLRASLAGLQGESRSARTCRSLYRRSNRL